MGAAVAKRDHPRFRAILKGETEVLGRVGDEDGISSLGVLALMFLALWTLSEG